MRTPAPTGFPQKRRNAVSHKVLLPTFLSRKVGVCSNKEKFAPLWDVWIHILGIRAECAWWGRAARVCRPYKRKGDLSPHPPPSGAPSPQGEGLRAGEDTRPYGNCGQKTAGAQCAPLHRIYKRLYIQEKRQVSDLSLKTQRRNAVSQKVLLVPFLLRKGTAYFLF